MREGGFAITFNDAIYMVANEGYVARKTIPVSNKCMTRAEIEEYLRVDPFTLDLSNYQSNQLVPYDRVIPGIVVVPTQITVGYLAGDFTFTIYDDYSPPWLITDDAGWFSLTPTSGGMSPLEVTGLYSLNTSTSPRSGTITVTSQSSGAIVTIPVTQVANPGVDVESTILNHGLTDLERCESTNQQVRFIPTGETFIAATGLYSNDSGTIAAPSGWYSDGTRWRRWTGSSFSDNGIC